MGSNLSTYNQAAAVLMERFPILGLLSSSWSETPIIEESLPTPGIEKAEVVYCYGLNASVYFQCLTWLKENKERKFVFLEDEPGIIASFLKEPKAVEILSDKQVHLELITKNGDEIESLSQKFPVQRVEVLSLPSKSKSLKGLKLKILRKTALSHALHLDRIHGYQPFANFIENSKQLPHSFYANAMKGAFKGIPAIVCGAGPSLQNSIEILRTLESKALIIAGGSTLAALSSQGIAPHFGMAIDPNLEEYRRFKNSFAFEVPMLYSTRVVPTLFQTCNGPFGYMRSGIGGIAELWLEEELGLLDPLIGEHLSSESISVTSVCVAWAQFLGCNPILLNGIDMAYTDNKHYASGVTAHEKIALQKIDKEKSAADRIIRRKNRNGKSISTAVRWVMESASISHFAKMHPELQFINTTDGGIGFKGIEYMPLKQAAGNFKESDVRALVNEKITACPMPLEAGEMVQKKITDLIKSLERVMGYLLILTGQAKGSNALAEMEIQEEIATLYLFYDVNQIYTVNLWGNWLVLAEKYYEVIKKFTS